MADRRGRRIVWRWLDRGGVYRISFTGDALTTAFNEGRRNEALALLSLVQALCPEQFALMTRERDEDDRRDRDERDQQRADADA